MGLAELLERWENGVLFPYLIAVMLDAAVYG